jgi:transposase
VCRNLGISQPTYYQWKKSADENDGQVKHIGSGNYANDQEKEIVELKRELKNSQDALKILKKAMGILAKEEQ